jgi:ATP/maltotriose-dependent transcriptional regulator MalT
MEALGEWVWLHPVYFALSVLWEDDLIAAERELRPGYEALSRIGEKSHRSGLAILLAQLVYAQGRYEEAEELAGEVIEASRPNDVHNQTICRTVKAKVLARRGEHEAAKELACEAIAFVGESDFVPVHAEALMDLAEVLELADEQRAAAVTVQEAARLFEQKGNVRAARRARARLEELA